MSYSRPYSSWQNLFKLCKNLPKTAVTQNHQLHVIRCTHADCLHGTDQRLGNQEVHNEVDVQKPSSPSSTSTATRNLARLLCLCTFGSRGNDLTPPPSTCTLLTAVDAGSRLTTALCLGLDSCCGVCVRCAVLRSGWKAATEVRG